MRNAISSRHPEQQPKERKSSMPAPISPTLIVRRDVADSKRHSASSMLNPSWAFALPNNGTVYRKYSDGGLSNDENFLVEASTGHILAKALKGNSNNLASIALYDHRDQRPSHARTPRVIQITRPSVFQSKYTFEYEGMIYRWGCDATSFLHKRHRDLYCDMIEDSSMDMRSDDRAPGLYLGTGRRGNEHAARPVAKFTRIRNGHHDVEPVEARRGSVTAVEAEELGKLEVDFTAFERRPLLDPKGLEILLVMTLAMVEEAVSEGIFKKRTSAESKKMTETAVIVSKSTSTKRIFGGFMEDKSRTVFV